MCRARISGWRYLVLAVFGMCSVVYGRTYTTDDVMDHDLLHLNLAYMRDRADLIICGQVQLLPPYKEGSKDLYRIIVDDAIKGSCSSGSLIVVHRDISSYQGKDPELEVNMHYLMFLERIDIRNNKAPSNSVCFQIIGTWKGVIPLENTAVEKRAVLLIQKDYSVNVIEQMSDFLDALRFSLKVQSNSRSLSTGTLSSVTLSLYNALRLNEDVRLKGRRVIGIYGESSSKSNQLTSEVLRNSALDLQPSNISPVVVPNGAVNGATPCPRKQIIVPLLVLVLGCCFGLVVLKYWKRSPLDRQEGHGLK